MASPTAAFACASLATSNATTASLSLATSLKALRTLLTLRPVATTRSPAFSAALAVAAPIPLPAPVMNQTLLMLLTLVVEVEGQLAQRLAGQLRDGIGEGRGQRWQAGFAHAGGRFGAGHDVHIKLGHVADARHRVVAEVALLDDAVLERDGRTRQAHRQAH